MVQTVYRSNTTPTIKKMYTKIIITIAIITDTDTHSQNERTHRHSHALLHTHKTERAAHKNPLGNCITVCPNYQTTTKIPLYISAIKTNWFNRIYTVHWVLLNFAMHKKIKSQILIPLCLYVFLFVFNHSIKRLSWHSQRTDRSCSAIGICCYCDRLNKSVNNTRTHCIFYLICLFVCDHQYQLSNLCLQFFCSIFFGQGERIFLFSVNFLPFCFSLCFYRKFYRSQIQGATT